MRIRMIPPVLLLAVAGTTALAAPGAEAGSTPKAVTATDWPMYHNNTARTGWASMPHFTGKGLKVAKKITLDGAVYASPIVARGLTIVATENNTVYAFNASNALVWKRHLGAPSPASERPCGNIDPLGITGTPIYYSKTGLIYVAAEFTAGSQAPTHRLYGLSVGTGAMKISHSLDVAGVDRRVMQERGALTIANGKVWVPFGGMAGDCGAYKGRVVGLNVSGSGSTITFTVPTAREAGIWTPPGPTVDKSGNLLVSVGNGASGQGDPYDYSDSVLKLNGAAKRIDSFSPSTWPTDNDADLDLGSQGPALVGKWVFIAGKAGTAYVLRESKLGGIGGQVSKATVCRSFGGTAVIGSVVYVPCTDGVRAISIDSAGKVHGKWRAASGTTGAPVVGGGWIWSLDTGAGVLHALSPTTGGSGAAVAVGSVTRFATPALSGRRILIGTTTGLTIVTY